VTSKDTVYDSEAGPGIRQNAGRLRKRVLTAGFWSMSGHGAAQLIRLGSNLIMTRLLVPEMFGVMAIVTVVMVGLHLVSDFGATQNIIQSKRGDDPVFLNAVWTTKVIRGFIIWFIALALSGGLYLLNQSGWFTGDTVYGNPLLPPVLAVVSFSAVIVGFNSTKLAVAVRLLQQKRMMFLEVGSQIVGILVMVAWAFIDRSIWALVAGWLVGGFTKSLLSHLLLPGVSNRLELNPTACREVIDFGKWMLLSSSIGFFCQSGDRLILGGMIDAETLGYYSIAYLLINAPRTAFSRLSGMVVFPALCEGYRDNKGEIKRTYYRFRFWIDAAVLFITGFLLTAANIVVSLLYDERYHDVGPMLQLLSLLLVAQRYALADQIYLAMGKPKLMTLLILIRTLALYGFAPVGFHYYGLYGALWAIIGSSFAALPVSLYLQAKYQVLDIKKELLFLFLLLPGLLFGEAVVSLWNY